MRSPKASGPLWDALVRHNNGMKNRADLDLTGITALSVAVGFFMDNNAKFSDGTSYKTFVLRQINKIEEVWVDLGACDRAVNFCGTATMYPITHADYMGYIQSYWALTYTLVRDQLTPAERTIFAEKALNGISKSVLPNCDNRLERLPGTIRITKVAGGAIITGITSSHGDLLNQWIYVKPSDLPYGAGGFVRPTIARSADTLFTPTAPYSSYLDKTLDIYRVKPWASGQCGFGFIAGHHSDVPKALVGFSQMKLAGALGATNTMMTVNSAAGLPNAFPYYVKLRSGVDKEIVKVTAASGTQLTIIRGEFSTPVRSWPISTFAEYSTHDTIGTDNGWNNRTITRHAGQMMLALALADDDPRAVTLLKESLDYWNKNTWFAAKNYFTMSSTSTNSYGLSRTVPFFMWVIQSLYGSFDPVLDYRTDWLKQAGSLVYLYWYTPWDAGESINWGIPSTSCQTMKSSSDFQCAAPAAYIAGLYPGSPEAGYAKKWLEDMNYDDNISLLSLIAGQRVLVPLLLYPTQSARDYRQELLPHYVGDATGDDDQDSTTNFSVAVSRTNWTNQASLLYVLAPDHNTKEFPTIPLSDKFFDSYNADYGIGKNGWLLGQLKPDGYWMRFAGFQNVVDFGPVSQLATRPWADLEIDRKRDQAPNHFYIRTNLTKGYGGKHKVQGAYRYFAHFKPSQGSEHIVVYDDYKTGLAQQVRGMLHYGNNAEAAEGNTALSPDGTIVESWNTTSKMYTTIAKVSGSGVVTDMNVVVSGTKATIGSYCSTQSPCRFVFGTKQYSYLAPAEVIAKPQVTGTAEVYIWLDPNTGKRMAAGNNAEITCSGEVTCLERAIDFPLSVLRLARMTWSNNRVISACPGQTTSTRGLEYGHCVGGTARHIFMDAGDKVTGAEFLVVHKPGDASVKPDAVAALEGLSYGFTGIEVLALSPKVAVFARDGLSHTNVQFTSKHSETAQYLVSGLEAGMYEVSRNGQITHTALEVRPKEQALYFESSSGIIQVRRVGTTVSLSIFINSLEGGRQGEAYLTTLLGTGGMPPYTWALDNGTIPPGMELTRAGQLMGTPSEAGLYSFTVSILGAEGDRVTQSMSLNIEPPDPSLRISLTSVEDAIRGVPYSFTLQARGGTLPYIWDLAEGEFPPGVTLDRATGIISGTPTETGLFQISIRVTDGAGVTEALDLALEVTAPE